MMRQTLINSVLCALLIGFIAATVFTQTPECPELSIRGPAGVVEPGEIAWFQATVSGTQVESLEFIWTTSSGKIDSREGSRRIGVIVRNEGSGMSITATVDVKGFPEGCPASASETMSYCIPVLSVQLDEYSTSVGRINETALNLAARELENNPNNQMYIIEYFPAKASKASVDRKLRLIRDYFRSIKFDPDRVTMVTVLTDWKMALTKIYRVPPGSENPRP